MKFTYSEISTAINKVMGAVSKRSTLPVLDYIKVDYKDEKIRFTATDLENTIIYEFPYMEEVEPFLLEAVKISQIVKVLDKAKDVDIIVSSEKVIIKQGKDKYILPVLPPEEYPDNPSADKFIALGEFTPTHTKMMSKVSKYAGHDDLRPVMSGAAVFFNKKNIAIIATNAHYLAETIIDFEKDDDIVYPSHVIIPNNALHLISKLFRTNYNIYNSDTQLALKSDDTTLLITKVDGKFPNYKTVIPKDNPNSFTINTRTFISSIAKASINANQATHLGEFRVNDNEVIIISQDIDLGQESEVIIEATTEGDNERIGLNLNFLSMLVKDIENEDTTIQFSSPGRAIIIEEESEEYKTLLLCMPVTLK